MRTRLLAAACLGAAACAAPGGLRADALAGTVWRERCPDPAIVTATVELRRDGLLGWTYDDEGLPDAFRLDSVHTWAVEDGALVVRWNLGAARSRYPAGADPALLAADTSTFCLPGSTLERLR